MRRLPAVAVVMTMALRGSPLAAAAVVTLVEDGRSKAVVALPPEADEYETLALKDLTDYVEKMSGARLDTAMVGAGDVDAFVAETRAKGKMAILIGRNVLDRLVGRIEGPSVRPHGLRRP